MSTLETENKTSIPNGLEKLVRSFEFRKETYIPHIFPGIMLIISLPAYISLIYNIMFHGVQEATSIWYTSLATLYIGYILASAISIYRLLKITHTHLVNSGITSYYWLKKLDDYDSIIKLYRSGVMRRDLPSPLTGLIATLLSGGIAYPILLYVVDKTMRDHYYGEEGKFLGIHITNRINVEHGLVYVAATLLTVGLFLIIWDYIIVRNYNRHVKTIHGSHPEPPSTITTTLTYGEHGGEIPILALSLAFLGAGIYGLLGIIGFMNHLTGTIGYGLLIAGIAAYYRRKSFSSQVGRVYGFIYLSFILFSIIGYTSAQTYYSLYEETSKQLVELRTNDLFNLTRNIFINNFIISFISTIPIIGPLYLGVGLGNAALYYGVAINIALSKGNLSILLLPLMPHAILELLAYAFFASLSMRIFIEKESKFTIYFVISALILFTAAFIEALSVVAMS